MRVAGLFLRREEHCTTATEISVIVAAGANAAGVILGIGRIQQAVSDIRDDINGVRQDIQSCLQTLLLTKQAGPPGESPK